MHVEEQRRRPTGARRGEPGKAIAAFDREATPTVPCDGPFTYRYDDYAHLAASGRSAETDEEA
jgi:hypothetical protein